jgi:hypothetical protein
MDSFLLETVLLAPLLDVRKLRKSYVRCTWGDTGFRNVYVST